MSYTIARDRYQRSVLDTARAVMEAAKGTGDTMSAVAMCEHLDWLEWRIGPGVWEPTTADLAPYEESVRALARHAARYCRRWLAEGAT